MPQMLYYQVKSPWYPLDRRLGGTQSQSGHSSEEKNFQPLPGFKLPIIQLAAQLCTTELSWLLYIYNVIKILGRSQSSSVTMVTRLWLDDHGSVSGRSGNIPLRHCVQTGSGTHHASCSMGTGGKTAGV
jgi:hypothetical protein